MSKVILGTRGAIEQPKQFGYNQQRGYFTRRSWKCTDMESATALVPQLLSAKYSYTITEGPAPLVEAEISAIAGDSNGTPEVPTDIWEKSVAPVQKDILETDYAKSVLNDYDLETLNQYKKDGVPLTSSQQTTLGAYGRQWYNMMKAGVTSSLVYQTILRHTQIVSSGYPLAWTITNDGKILTNSQLVSLEGLPGDLKFSIPSSGSSADYWTGWLKVPATIQSSSYDKWIVTQEYQYGEWIKILYNAAS